jgi:8-oxo-dGTP pyrophosphatase MutT (NUDIX family)
MLIPPLTDSAPARPSSTVVLVREANGDPEIFMVKRHASASFGSAHAFPGGVLDAEDAEVHDYCGDLGNDEANTKLGVKESGLDYYSAAIRELFEESGVLLADLSRIDEDLNVIRDGLNDGTSNWLTFVAGNKLDLHCGELHYIGHWITPLSQLKRYTTRFFVAILPQGQEAIHCGGELTESRWSSARDMLAAGRNGDVDLHFPTIKTLESLARHDTLTSLVEWAQSCAQWGVTTMLPAMIERNGREQVVLPGDKDYPGAKA